MIIETFIAESDLRQLRNRGWVKFEANGHIIKLKYVEEDDGD